MKSKFIVPFVLLFIVVIIQFGHVIATHATYFARDLTYLFHPWRTFAAQSIQTGQIPLWNEYSYCGMPFMANMQTALWYPFTIIFYLFPFVIALKIFHVLHYVLAGFLGFLLARKCKVPTGMSLVSGILFSLNGYLITKMEFLSIIGTAVWFPFCILARRNPYLLGIAFALTFFAGYPHLILFQIIGIIVFELLSGTITIRNIFILFLGGIVGLLISSIQFFPAWELFGNSMRGISGLSQDVVGHYSLHIRDFIGLIMPYVLNQHSYQITGEKIFWTTGMHIGITGCIVACVGFWCSSFVKKVWYMIIIGIVVFIALGSNTMIFNFLYDHVFVMKLFRYPSHSIYLLMIIIFFLSIRYGRVHFKRYHQLIFIPLLIELCVLNYRPYPVIESEYFHYKGETISFLQERRMNGRYLLSPKTQNDSGVYSWDVSSGWYLFKERLAGQIGLPFHLYNADGFGEPLVLNNQRKIIEPVISAKNIDTALRRSRDARIAYILFSYPVEEKYNPTVLNNGVSIVTNENISGTYDLQLLYYPGWKAYARGRELKLIEKNNGWMGISDPAPARRGWVRYLYRPLSYCIGLMLSLLTIVYLCIYGLHILHKQWSLT